mmetsp:Transcript_12057/g.15396  ORF Transcript_12057/g.15396 Transcript_12057/m.15396 type:complete len:189 (+) Transcript_12057:13-579(+)
MADIIWFALAVFALFIIIVAQQGYREDLFDESLDFIPRIQKGASESKQGWWHFYSTWGGNLATFLPFIIAYFDVNERPRAYYYLFVSAGIDTSTAVIKLNDHQARPFWVGVDVQAFSCSTSYGNPSGHCFTCMGVPLAVWLDYNSRAITTPSIRLSAWYWRALFFALMLLFTGMIAYSRMFLGVHSLN